jgi:N-methylhydantoinase A/oxoprolinase/acetone carboxylase beta subunit
VTVSEDGATVSDYKTSVKAANLLSIALGGDSSIAWGPDKEIVVGPERVTPLAYLAWRHRRVGEQLKALSMRTWSQATPDWLEYWFLLRDPPPGSVKGQRERDLIAFLRDGPRPVPEVLRQLDVLHVGQIDVQRLSRLEIIGKAGLTATDLMHIEGTYGAWSRTAAAHAWEVFCQFQFADPDELRQQVWSLVSERALQAAVAFLSQKPLELRRRQHSLEGTDDDLGRWFFYNSLYEAHPYLETSIRLRPPIIGIGAPAGIILPAIAEALRTDLILPEHYQVANAVGAIAGSVMVEEELLVYPKLSRDGLEVFGYYVQAHDERHEFEELKDALGHARALSQERALGGALRSGADHPQVTVEEKTDGLDTFRVRAQAIGNPRLTR